MVHGKPSVVKRGAGPRGRGVTGCASRWETCRRMVRVCCPGVVCLVARIAIGRGSSENATNMAKVASDGHMSAR